MRVIGYVLANRVGQILTIPARLEEAVARELLADGWQVYRVIRA
jgi:hypothetical protein